MAYKSWKPKNNNYIDGAGIRVNRKTLLDYIFPVGSVFLTVNKVNPGTFLGGTWEQIYGGYLYAAQNSIGSQLNGWNAQPHKLLVNETPKHTHSIGFKTSWGSTVWNQALVPGYNGPTTAGESISGTSNSNTVIKTYVSQQYGLYFNETIGGDGTHTHDIATRDVFAYKRIA